MNNSRSKLPVSRRIASGQYGWLSASLLLLSMTYPVLALGGWGYVMWLAMFWLVLGGCLRAVTAHPRIRIAVAVIGGSAVLTSAIGLWQGETSPETGPFAAIGRSLSLVFLAVATATTLRDVFGHARVTGQTLLGAACGYILLGLTFAFALLVLHGFGEVPIENAPGELPEPDLDAAGQTARYLYFSFVTLSTLGYGDMIPASSIGELLATGEAIVGQLYLAVFIARLVGMHVARNGWVEPSSE